jgi:signal transduction histidine kinase
MPHSALFFFAPPVPKRVELRSQARALWLVSWPFFAVVAAVLGVAVLVEPYTLARRASTVIAVGALVTLLHAVSHRGRPILASWMLVIGLSVIVTQRAWITGGIHAPVAVFYALFIVMAGALLGTRSSVVTAVVCFLGATVLTVAETLGWLTPRPGAGPSLGAFLFAILAIGLALVLQTLIALRQREGLGLGAVPTFAHDMRVPLQILIGHLELLRQDTSGETAEHVESAMGGARMLNRLTNSLLDVSRLEAGRMPVHVVRTDLDLLACSIVTSIRILQPVRNIRVEAVGDTVCECDPELMRRVLENLVSNAMKHTPVDSAVRVAVSGLPDRVRVAVHDDGPGVPPETRTRMFEPFSADGLRSANGYESCGLGLAFCRLAVEAHGGRIRVEDGRPRGSVFVVELYR